MSPSLHAEDDAVKIAARLSVLATVAVTGLILAATGAAVASAAPAAGHAAAVTSGTKLWEARYAASGRGAFSLASAISPDGSTLFLTGGTRRKVHEISTPTAGATLAYNPATGAKMWQANYNPGGLSTSSFSAIAVSPDSSTVFVAGTTQPKVDGPSSIVVAAYNAATGADLWTEALAAQAFTANVAVSPDGGVAVSPDSSEVFVTGDTSPYGTTIGYSS